MKITTPEKKNTFSGRTSLLDVGDIVFLPRHGFYVMRTLVGLVSLETPKHTWIFANGEKYIDQGPKVEYATVYRIAELVLEEKEDS